MIAWMLYALAVSAALAAAGWFAERALRLLGRPTRWVWVGTIAGAIALPLIALRPRTLPYVEVGIGPITGGIAAHPMGAGDVAAETVSWAPWIAAAWIVASIALLLWAAAGTIRLARARRRWPRREVDGMAVHISPDTGPAVVGALRPRIVLPEWTLDLPKAERFLLLRHEQEHIAARDPLLLRAVFLSLVALPWNLPLWWQAHRLRAAIEIDCDARVVRATADPARYGHLLIDVGARRSGHPWAALALSFRPSLEQRIRAMITTRPKHSTLRAAGFAAAIALPLTVIAAADPPVVNAVTPTSSVQVTLPEHATTTAAVPADTNDVRAEPRFTPYEEAPEIRNRVPFQRALVEAFPSELREAGVGGRTILWLFVDEEGRVGEVRLAESSGREALDEVALRTVREVEFTPARHRGERVAVWVQFPVTFQLQEGAEGEMESPAQPETPAERRVTPAESPAEAGDDQPTFTPFEQAPEIRDREAFERAMREAYPESLREAGVGGTTILWVHIDDTGRVADTRVERSSGQEALDRAAERVLRDTEFTPGVNRGEPVAVWVQFPVRFGAE